LAGGSPAAPAEPPAGEPLYVSRSVEEMRLKDLRDDEILAYLAHRAATRNPDSPHYRPQPE
jgi:hypothetical protein